MSAPILAAALVAVLPAGQGSRFTSPVTFVSEPPGAVVSMAWRGYDRQPVEASCVTPCSLDVPRSSPFVLNAEKQGFTVTLPRLRWGGAIVPVLSPAVAVVTLKAAQ